MKRCIVVLLFAAVAAASAQTTRPRFIRTVGEGVASGKPDQAKVDFSVITQAATAQDASAQNADKTTAVLNVLRQVLGPNADIRTINYSVTGNYKYDGTTSTLIGFTASNTVEAVVNDISLPGKLIDAAIQAGANRVDSLRFLVKDDQPLRREALRLASVQARQHADAIALGLGLRVGSVLSAEEGYATPVPIYAGGMAGTAAATTTPVEAGTVDVHATVTLDIEITQ